MGQPYPAPYSDALRPPSSPPPPPDAHLESEINGAIKFSLAQTKSYGFIYYSIRTALIVLSVCASAKGIAFLISAAPWLSLLVAVGTGIDTWLKPEVRHKIHYTYHDRFRQMLTELRFIDTRDARALEGIKKRFLETDDTYRKDVFSV